MKIKNLSLILLASLILGASGNKEVKPAEKPKQETSQVEDTNTGVKEVSEDDKKTDDTDKEKAPEVAMNMEDAVKIFHEHNFGDASADSFNFDKIKVEILDKDIIYSIEGFKDGKEYQLKINNNGKILEEKIEDDDDKKKLAIDFTKIISGEDAWEKSLEGQAEDVKVKEYELKIEDGKVVYDIELDNGKDVKIDATTGDIIKRD
ncbi:PepSY domain-containing protein [Anaerococcus sp. NML200574]|uniref:PepSY domain-containing protein n=1 Tax=Anaerococcus sp. NML200574 TaxID=2954486 RepID=UPI0022388E04|nr:PepSY domain-containing protein [Anaerococcus sp. NML200574]MCW6678368.1 PepSY domain-containing protein [Anaerococcus sp. NML200574]